MITVKINSQKWTYGLKTASKTYNLIGPVKNKFGYTFDSLPKGVVPSFDFSNTIMSPKNVLFPQSENIIKFSINESKDDLDIEAIKRDFYSQAIIGIRPCDAKANLILKMNFDTPEIKDPYWLELYKSTTFVGLACEKPCNTCFCTSMNSSPYGTEGLDLIIIPKKNDNYIINIITPKGEKFSKVASWVNSKSDKEYFNFDQSKIEMESKIPKILPDLNTKIKNIELLDLYNAPFWDDVSFACLNCGICTFICPTCWCFDIQDEIQKKSGIRNKNWDSCMFPIFTIHTTGHNPRESKTKRMRQRFMHKLKYFLDKYNEDFMCVGCGRCIRSCPVNIDIRNICSSMINLKPEGTCTD